MEILIATTTATSTLYSLTDKALDLINFLTQLNVFFGSLIIGLILVAIVVLIFK